MRPTSVTLGSATTSEPIPLDYRQSPFSVGIGVVVSDTATFKVQHTFDNVLAGDTPTWFDHADGAKTASDDFNYAFPVMAIRLNVTNWTSGTVTMTVLQGVR